MFNNMGNKIKKLAKVICWIGIIGSIITGLILIAIGCEGLSHSYYSNDDEIITIIAGLLIAIVGSIISWIGSFKLYGFGDLVNNVQEIRYIIAPVQITQNNTQWSYPVQQSNAQNPQEIKTQQ